MPNLFDYHQTPASNQSAAPHGASEGMPPSGLNDVQRQMMANLAGGFKVYTAGGTASAMTITLDPAPSAYSDKMLIWFKPPAANTGAFTVNVNSLGAVSVKGLDGADPAADAVNTSGVFGIHHEGTNFVLLNPVTSLSTPVTHNADYTLVLSDAGKTLVKTAADTTTRTWTIPLNSSVAFPLGTIIKLMNFDDNNLTIAADSTAVLYWMDGTATAVADANRTLGRRGSCIIQKTGTDEWIIEGNAGLF